MKYGTHLRFFTGEREVLVAPKTRLSTIESTFRRIDAKYDALATGKRKPRVIIQKREGKNHYAVAVTTDKPWNLDREIDLSRRRRKSKLAELTRDV
jgi:hypothetical protein